MRPFLILATLALVAGCVQTPTADPSGPQSLDLTKPLSWSYAGSKCRESDVILLVDKAKLQSKLPEGFRPADASTLGGSPVAPETGKGVALGTAFACDETDLNSTFVEGQVAILVEAPEVEAENLTPAFIHFYEVSRYVPMGQPGPGFDALNWTHEHGNVTAAMERTGGSGAVTGHEEAKAYSFSVTTPGSAEASGTARFWHKLPTGMAWVDYTFDSPVEQLLGAAECSIQPGTPLHNVSGITTCSPDNSLGMGFATLAPKVTIRYQPGLNATK